MTGPTRKLDAPIASKLPSVYLSANGVGLPSSSEVNEKSEVSDSTIPAAKHITKPTRRCWYVSAGQQLHARSSRVGGGFGPMPSRDDAACRSDEP